MSDIHLDARREELYLPWHAEWTPSSPMKGARGRRGDRYYAQVEVFSSRLLNGKRVDSQGNEYPLHATVCSIHYDDRNPERTAMVKAQIEHSLSANEAAEKDKVIEGLRKRIDEIDRILDIGQRRTVDAREACAGMNQSLTANRIEMLGAQVDLARIESPLALSELSSLAPTGTR